MADAPKLLTVVYRSVETDPLDDEQLSKLLAWCREWNGSVGVTGLLMHREGRFIQFLEGPEKAVRDLVTNISKDSRHARVRVLLEDFVATRQFPEWTMGFQPVDSDAMPDGFRRSFEDLEAGDDRTLMVQAARELTMWFRSKTN